jgi:hypothetical protein
MQERRVRVRPDPGPVLTNRFALLDNEEPNTQVADHESVGLPNSVRAVEAGTGVPQEGAAQVAWEVEQADYERRLERLKEVPPPTWEEQLADAMSTTLDRSVGVPETTMVLVDGGLKGRVELLRSAPAPPSFEPGSTRPLVRLAGLLSKAEPRSMMPDGYAPGKYDPPTPVPTGGPQFRPTADQLQGELRREASEFELDVDLYCYLVLKALFVQRTVMKWSELKSKAETWIRSERPLWDSLTRTAQIIRGMAMLQRMNAGEKFVVGAWQSEALLTVDGNITQTHKLHEFATKGELPNTGLLGKLFWRRRKIPVR